jgi:hypothetical protein
MPYTIEWEGRGFYKRFTGRVAFQEYARSQEEVTSDPRFDDAKYIINDFLAIDGYTISHDDAEYSAAYTRGPSYTNPRVRVAYVTNDAKISLLVRMAKAVSFMKIETFPTLAAARAWCLAERD